MPNSLLVGPRCCHRRWGHGNATPEPNRHVIIQEHGIWKLGASGPDRAARGGHCVGPADDGRCVPRLHRRVLPGGGGVACRPREHCCSRCQQRPRNHDDLAATDANEQPAQPASPTVSVTSDGFHTITLSTARTCTDNEIQLEGGTSAAEGNVLICHESEFRPVCDDFWSDEDAGVVCRQLGYATGSYTQESFFGDSQQLGARTERGELRGEGPGQRDGLHHPGPRRGRIERERPGGGDGDNYGVHQQPPRSSPRIRRRARWPAAAPRSRRLAIRSRRRTRTTTI